ncbi:MAG: type IV pilus assembly protein PilM [Verrucomicrobiota bacterium]
MLKTKTFLGIDFGAGSLKVGEFEPAEDGGLRLVRFAVKPLGLAGSQDAARDNLIKKALAEILAEGGFASRAANLCAPDYQVFSKFVKLPPVDTSKVTQIIQYEAQQNVPFPLAETSWDYQILGTSAGGELEVLLLAIKSDAVEKLFASAEGAGLKMEVVDASFAALCNAFRFNYGDQEGCSLLVDIGAKTSNVLLFEKNKFYARSVNVGANAITQEFAAESKLPFAEAEKIKVNDGFVSLGGAYEEPDNPRVAAVSKVARNVLTRLHLQVNQTIQFYRTQQGGGAPARVFLCGGGSLMPYAAEFFHEKLTLPVEIFNPLRNVQIDPSVDVAALEKVAQCFGEVVGVGLRNIAQCPAELNLMPKSSRTRQEFNSKKPFLLAAAYALVVGVFAYGLFYNQVAGAREEGLARIGDQVSPLSQTKSRLDGEEAKLKKAKEEADQLVSWLEDQTFWADVIGELRRVLRTTEDASRQKLGVPVGIWIEKMLTTEPATPQVAASSDESGTTTASPYIMDPVLARRYGLIKTPAPGGEGGGDAAAPAADAGATKKSKSSGNTNEIATLNLRIRAVNVATVRQGANSAIAYDVEKAMKESPLFEATETEVSGSLETVEDSAPSFSFPLKVKLKRPMKL